jgi:hypothetical protein
VDYNEFTSPDITSWRLFRSAIEHENTLVNHRLTWLLSSQAFLFSAFVLVFLAWSKQEVKRFDALVPFVLAVIGFFAIYICLVVHVGISRATYAIHMYTRNYLALSRASGFDKRTPPIHHWVRGHLIDQRHIPIATLLVWIILISICALYQIPQLREAIQGFGIQAALILLLMAAVMVAGFAWGSNSINSKTAKAFFSEGYTNEL